MATSAGAYLKPLEPIHGWRRRWMGVIPHGVTPRADHLTLLTLLRHDSTLLIADRQTDEWTELTDPNEAEMESGEIKSQQAQTTEQSPKIIYHSSHGSKEFINKLRAADNEQKVHLLSKIMNFGLDLTNQDTEQESPKFLIDLQKISKALENSKEKLEELSKECAKYRLLKLEREEPATDSTLLQSKCTIETNQVRVETGDMISVLDAGTPNKLQIKCSSGHGKMPILAYLLPSADLCVTSALNRLNLQLVANSSHALNKIGKQLLTHLSSTLRAWSSDKMRTLQSVTNGERQNTLLTIGKLDESLQSRQLSQCEIAVLLDDINKMSISLKKHEQKNSVKDGATANLRKITDDIDLLLQIVKNYKNLKEKCDDLKADLIKRFPRFTFVDDLNTLQPVSKGRRYRYYEVKTTVQKVETVENITYVKPLGATDISGKTERIETDQITQSSNEERRKFIIRAVIDPLTQAEISFKDAISRGIIDQSSGMYIDKKTKTSIPIPEAMNRRLIIVDFSTTSKSKEEKKSMGLITIKTKPEPKPYKVTAVMDIRNEKFIPVEEATAKGILDEGSGTFLNTKSGKIMTMSDAMIEGLLLMEERQGEDEREEIKTYAVYAVVDPVKREKISFSEAVKKGLLEANTGNYKNTLTGETIYVGEAIRRGFLKARIVADPSKLNVHVDNRMVIERVDHIKKKFLKPMGIISAMKRISKVDISQK